MTQTEQLYENQIDSSVPVPMRDGTILRADVYRPKAKGKWPVVLNRFIADPADEYNVDWGTFFSQRGYAYVYNNVRGTYESEGVFFPLIDDGWGENRDGYDTVEWAARQTWSDGNVGMIGVSYGGFTQYMTAPTRPPSLKACLPIYACNFKEVVFPRGIYHLHEHRSWAIWMAMNCLPGLDTTADKEMILARLVQAFDDHESWIWHLPVKECPPLEGVSPWHFEHLEHLTDVHWWDSTDARTQFSEIDVPMLHVAGWYDMYVAGTIEHFSGLTSQGSSEDCRNSQRLIVGPWAHTGVAGPPEHLDFGSDAYVDFQQLALGWFDHWLKKKPIELDMPAIRLFLMGENRWLELDQWPSANIAYTAVYFRQGTGKSEHSLNSGQLTFSLPDADEQSDSYTYDPKSPIIGYRPSIGEKIFSLPDADAQPDDYVRDPEEPTIRDQPLMERGEVYQRGRESQMLTYTTELLREPVCVIGPVRAILYASSSAPDTDWVVRLCDVWPDGRSVKVCDGMVRARYRNSLEKEEFMEPGAVYRFEIDMTVTAQTFLAGHRIRVQVTSSDFPRFDRNLNTDGPFGEEIEGQVAINTVFHDAERPSHVVLPLYSRL